MTTPQPAEIHRGPFKLSKLREGAYHIFRDGARIGSLHQVPVNERMHALRWRIWITNQPPSGYLQSLDVAIAELADI